MPEGAEHKTRRHRSLVVFLDLPGCLSEREALRDAVRERWEAGVWPTRYGTVLRAPQLWRAEREVCEAERRRQDLHYPIPEQMLISVLAPR